MIAVELEFEIKVKGENNGTVCSSISAGSTDSDHHSDRAAAPLMREQK
jgi:hypothetical protein